MHKMHDKKQVRSKGLWSDCDCRNATDSKNSYAHEIFHQMARIDMLPLIAVKEKYI